METHYDIFISYRRIGGKNYSRTLKPELEKRGFRVFLDFDELKDGVFDQRIKDAISDSPVFIIILSKGALDRCANEGDWVREEILHAKKCHCHIVPIEFDKSFRTMPETLPEDVSSIIGGHSWAQIDTESLLQESIDKLVQHRIRPHLNQQQTENNSIDTESCQVMKDGGHHIIFEKEVEMPEGTKSDNEGHIVKQENVFIPEESKLKATEEALRVFEDMRLRPTFRRKRVFGLRIGPILFGYANNAGQVVLPCQWKYAGRFHNGLARVQTENGKWGFINTKGDSVISCVWEEVHMFSEDLALVKDSAWWYGFIDKSGELVIPCIWKKAFPFSDSLSAVEDANEKWGFIDKTGTVVIPCQWKTVWPFSNGFSAVKGDDMRWHFINKTGGIEYNCGEWDDAWKPKDGGCFARVQTGKEVRWVKIKGSHLVLCEDDKS